MKLIILFLPIIISSNISLAEKKLETQKKQSQTSANKLYQLTNPFEISTAESKKIVEKFRQRLLQKEDIKKVSDRIKHYQQTVKQHRSKQHKKNAQNHKNIEPVNLDQGNLSYETIKYINSKKLIRLAKVKDKSLNFYKDITDKVEIEKQVDFLWFDLKNEDPLFLRSLITDKVTLNNEYIKTLKGKKLINFLTRLRGDKKLSSKQAKELINTIEIAYEFNPQKGSIDLLLSMDIDKRVQIKIVARLEEYTKLLHHRLLYPSSDKTIELLLPMLSMLKIKELHLRLKLKDNINDIATALNNKESEQLIKQYHEYKQVTAEQWYQRYSPLISLEQALSFKQAIINFAEYKQAIILRIDLQQAERIPTLVTYIMLAKKNPKILATVLKTLNLSLANE